jgi:hypothetical protein
MSTLVSNFELLFKPLTPQLSPELTTIGRRALQGYFVSITNLDTREFVYTLEYRVSLPVAGAPAGRRDLSAAVVITDVAGDNNFAAPVRNGTSNLWTSTVRIPAGKTALVVLLPNVGTPNFFSGPADIEVRGHLRLTLNCRLTPVGTIGNRPILRFEPQSTSPVTVLVHAEHRTTFLPNGWPMAGGGNLDFDQVGTSLALAEGRGEFNITPRTNCLPLFASLTDDVLTGLAQGQGILAQLGEEGRAEAMVEALGLIATLGDEEAGMAESVATRLKLGCAFREAKGGRKR